MTVAIRIVVFILTTLICVEILLGFRVEPPSSATNQVDADNSSSVAYVKASFPVKLFQCLWRFNIMRCMRIFILQRMERTPTQTRSSNVTGDFLDRILSSDEPNEGNLWDSAAANLTDAQLNERLQLSFRTFFNDREIKLYFIPGVVVKVVPSVENYLHFTIKKNSSDLALRTSRSAETKDDIDGAGAGGNGKKKPYKTTEYLLQLGVPALMMPAILLGTVLPFLLPALKMATIVSFALNHGALMTAAMIAAKQAAFDGEKHYYSPGYHRDLIDL